MNKKPPYLPPEIKEHIAKIWTTTTGKIILVILGISIIGVSLYFFNKNPDGWVEEYVEDIIEEETGIPFDLTPGSEE